MCQISASKYVFSFQTVDIQPCTNILYTCFKLHPCKYQHIRSKRDVESTITIRKSCHRDTTQLCSVTWHVNKCHWSIYVNDRQAIAKLILQLITIRHQHIYSCKFQFVTTKDRWFLNEVSKFQSYRTASKTRRRRRTSIWYANVPNHPQL